MALGVSPWAARHQSQKPRRGDRRELAAATRAASTGTESTAPPKKKTPARGRGGAVVKCPVCGSRIKANKSTSLFTKYYCDNKKTCHNRDAVKIPRPVEGRTCPYHKEAALIEDTRLSDQYEIFVRCPVGACAFTQTIMRPGIGDVLTGNQQMANIDARG